MGSSLCITGTPELPTGQLSELASQVLGPLPVLQWLQSQLQNTFELRWRVEFLLANSRD